jgi:hypothetical protein
MPAEFHTSRGTCVLVFTFRVFWPILIRSQFNKSVQKGVNGTLDGYVNVGLPPCCGGVNVSGARGKVNFAPCPFQTPHVPKKRTEEQINKGVIHL